MAHAFPHLAKPADEMTEDEKRDRLQRASQALQAVIDHYGADRVSAAKESYTKENNLCPVPFLAPPICRLGFGFSRVNVCCVTVLSSVLRLRNELSLVKGNATVAFPPDQDQRPS